MHPTRVISTLGQRHDLKQICVSPAESNHIQNDSKLKRRDEFQKNEIAINPYYCDNEKEKVEVDKEKQKQKHSDFDDELKLESPKIVQFHLFVKLSLYRMFFRVKMKDIFHLLVSSVHASFTNLFYFIISEKKVFKEEEEV